MTIQNGYPEPVLLDALTKTLEIRTYRHWESLDAIEAFEAVHADVFAEYKRLKTENGEAWVSLDAGRKSFHALGYPIPDELMSRPIRMDAQP